MWQCAAERCRHTVCKKCVSNDRLARALPVEPAIGVSAPETPQAGNADQGGGVDTGNQDFLEENVAQILKKMPPVLPFRVPEKVPNRAKARVGRIMVKLLDKLVWTMPFAEDQPVQDVQDAVLLCNTHLCDDGPSCFMRQG